jgi:hypothetical protein
MPQVTLDVPEGWTAETAARALASYCRKRQTNEAPDMDVPSDDDHERRSGRPMRAKKLKRSDEDQEKYDNCIVYLKRHYLRYLSLEEHEIAPIIHRFFDPDWSVNDENYVSIRLALIRDIRCWQFKWISLFEVDNFFVCFADRITNKLC